MTGTRFEGTGRVPSTSPSPPHAHLYSQIKSFPCLTALPWPMRRPCSPDLIWIVVCPYFLTVFVCLCVFVCARVCVCVCVRACVRVCVPVTVEFSFTAFLALFLFSVLIVCV